MKKTLKIFLCTLCALCLSGTAFAQESTVPKTYTLTLEEAIDMALENNPQLKVLEIEQKSNEINLDAAKRSQYSYKNYPIIASNYEIRYVKEGYYVDTYEMLMRLNVKKVEQTKAQIKYNVTESYYNYKIATALCDIAENAYNLANENLSNVTKRFELGMIAKIDLDNAALSVESVKNTFDTYTRNAEIAKGNLKINLQLSDEDCEFILTDDIIYEEFSATPDEDIAKAMESRYDVIALKENHHLAQNYFDYTKGLTEASANYQTAYSDLVSKEYSYTNNKNLIALSIRNTYNNVLNCSDALSTKEKSVNIAKQRYDINKIKFESGMITNSELTQSLNEYLSENIALENAKLNYKMAVEKYNAEISIGL